MPKPLRFGVFIAPFSVSDGNPTLQLRHLISLAGHLDDLGFHEAWYGEHHSGGLEIVAAPDVLIAAAAEHTTNLRFGTGVLSLPFHHPLIAADRICQLDHQTRGRLIFGTGPGVLTTDSHMMGLDPTRQRGMQREALDVIMPLLRGESVTHQSSWFTLNDARLHLLPHGGPGAIEVAAASTISPSGSVLAAAHGLSLLSLAAGDKGGYEALDRNWAVYEKESVERGRVADRAAWRLVSPMFLADTVEEARRAVSKRVLGIISYVERTYNVELLGEYTAEAAIERWVSDGIPGFGRLVLGTPDEAIAHIASLQEKTGGFGTYMVNHIELASWEATKRSFELIASEVMPRFQGSNAGREASMTFMRDNSEWLSSGFASAVRTARDAYYGPRDATDQAKA